MKRFLTLIAPLLAAVLLPHSAALADDSAEETQLIGVLQNSQSVADKADACARLKWIGDARSVPALAQLLTDGDLSHSARYALESMQAPEAGSALRAAVATTTGSNQVGIINSLAVRREADAVSDVAKLLGSPDAEVAVSSAKALGKIGGKEALAALQTAWDGSAPGPVHNAQCDGLLAVANRLLTTGERAKAAKIFQAIYDHEKDDGFRFAAFRGIVLASEKRGIVLMVDAIKQGGGPSQGAALQVASTVGGPATTHALADLLPALTVPGQIAVLQALQQRGDRQAMPRVKEMLGSPDADVRLAAIAVLDELGDDTVALPLAIDASTATGAEKAAARQALIDLKHGGVADALLKPLPTTSAGVQAELIRALGGRGDSVAAPKLLELAQNGNESIRPAAFEGLALLAGPPQVPGLVQLIVETTNDDIRSSAADTLATVCQHIQAQGAPVDASALAQATKSASPDARLALLGVCSSVTAPQTRDVLRAALASPEPTVRAAAIRALCASQDEELLPDILKIAAEEKAANFRMLAIRGAVRLVTQDQVPATPDSRKIEALKSVLATTFNAEGKRLVLSGVATIPDLDALSMAVSLLDDAEVKVEAEDATIRIARALSAKDPAKAAAALHQVLNGKPDDGIRKSARAALNKIKVVE